MLFDKGWVTYNDFRAVYSPEGFSLSFQHQYTIQGGEKKKEGVGREMYNWSIYKYLVAVEPMFP